MNNDIKQLIDNSLIFLSLRFPIYAELIAKIGIKIMDEKEEYVAYTNGKCIYINPKYLTEKYKVTHKIPVITKEHITFILCHELLHLIGLTYQRGEQKDKEIDTDKVKAKAWNIATDLEINSILIEDNVGEFLKGGLYSPELKNKTAEEIYDELLKNQKLMDALENDMSGVNFDKHVKIDTNTQNEIISRFGEILEEHKKFNSINDGEGFERYINKIYEPAPFNWKRALNKYIKSWIRGNYTWNKRNRSGISRNLILPSCDKTPSIHIAMAIDTSGSLSEKELYTLLSYVYTLMKQFKSFTLDLWACGSVVYKESFITITEKSKNKIKDFKLVSDGGNDMRKNFTFIEEHYKLGNMPDIFICLSDFYDELDGDTETTSKIPCVFMCINHEEFVKPSKIKAEVFHISKETL